MGRIALSAPAQASIPIRQGGTLASRISGVSRLRGRWPHHPGERLFSHLAAFKGVLQVDGCAAYPKLAKRGKLKLAFCWVHGARAAQLLRTRDGRGRTNRKRGVEACYRILRDRERDPRPPPRAAAEKPSAGRCLKAWPHAKQALISQKIKLADHLLRALALGRALQGLDPKEGKPHHLKQKNTVPESRNLRLSVRASSVADRNVNAFKFQLARPEDQIEITERIEVAEVCLPCLKTFIIFSTENLCAAWSSARFQVVACD
jgi:hypothetical protein